MNELSNIILKVHRSHDLLTELEPAYAKFINENPFQLRTDLDKENRRFSYHIHGLKEVPIEIRIRAGEVITHLRSALDQMIWQLSLFFEKEPSKKTQFPICETIEKFKEQRIQIRALPEELKKIVEEFQPFNYENPQTHPMWVLNRLANDDKHRFITIVNSSAVGFGAQLEDGIAIEHPIGPVRDGSKILEIDFSGYHSDFTSEVEAKLNLSFKLGICLQLENDQTLRPVKSTLLGLGELVVNVANRFYPYFVKYSSGL